jgi:hypothetical protein
MKQLVILCSIILLASCQKSKNVVADVATSGNVNSNATTAKITAKINNRSWRSAARTGSTDTNVYIAAIKDGALQIKTFGSFTDSSGAVSQDQLGIYLDGVSDTGTYTLSLSNYIVYNQQLATPLYFSSQMSYIGSIRITNLTDTSISGTFNCQVENTSGSGSVSVKEGVFTNVIFQ